MYSSTGFFRAKRRVKLSYILVIGLVVCLAWLVAVLFKSQISLHDQLTEDLRKDMIIRTGPIEHFFQERLNDLRDLMEHHHLLDDLTASPPNWSAGYEPKDNLLPVEREFKKIMIANRLADQPIYTFIGLVDPAGRLLAKRGRRDLGVPMDLGRLFGSKKYLTEPEITVLKTDGENLVLGLIPLLRNGKPVGLILIEINACAMFQQIVGGFEGRLQATVRLIGRVGNETLTICGNVMTGSDQPVQRPDRLHMSLKIKKTPFSVLIDLPLAHEHESLLPSWVLFFLVGLIAILLVSLSFLLKAERRVSALQKRVAEEERVRRIQLEEMTEKLDNEIRERAHAQVDMVMKNELLECVRDLLTDTLGNPTVNGAAASGLEAARRLTKSRFGAIATRSGDRKIKVLAQTRPGPIDGEVKVVDASQEIELGGVAKEACESGRLYLVNNLEEDPVPGLRPSDSPAYSVWLFAPIRMGDESHGIIFLAGKEGGFNQFDREAIEDLSTSLAAVFRHKKIEESLRLRDEQNRTLVESITEGLIIVDKNLKIKYINDSLVKLLDLNRSEVERRSVMDFMDDENRNLLRDQWKLRQAGEQKPYELTFLTKDGQGIQAMIYPKPFYDEDGAFAGALSLVVNLNQRKRQEAQTLQNQKLEAIGQLAAGIAHEINTPTNFVSNNVRFFQDNLSNIFKLMKLYEDLKGQVEQGGDSSQTLRQIDEAAEEADLEFIWEELPIAMEETLEGLDHIAKIVRSMKEFAHPGLDEKILYNINDGLRSTATVSKNEWKYVAEMEWNLEEGLPPVVCVPSQINQVFLNILVNAAHAIGENLVDGSAEQGRITISTKKEGESVEVRIADTGPGVPEEIKTRIFEPFFTTKEPGKGTGQGLAIAYSVIVDNHNGSIAVESAPEGGSVFVITLPVDMNEEE